MNLINHIDLGNQFHGFSKKKKKVINFMKLVEHINRFILTQSKLQQLQTLLYTKKCEVLGK